jgi:hypothetical protein
VSDLGRDDWDDRRLDAAFQTRFDQTAPAQLRDGIVHDIAVSSAAPTLLQSFRAITQTAVAAIAIIVVVIATVTIAGLGPTVPPGSSATAPATAPPTTPPSLGTVGPPFPSVIRLSVLSTTYAVISVADAASIRDHGVDAREIAVAGWYVPPRLDLRCAAPPPDFVEPLEGWCGESSLLGGPEPTGLGETPSGSSLQPATEWRPANSALFSTAVVFVGHFDDARAAQCVAGDRRQRCEDRFVVDIVPWDDASLAGFPTTVGGLPVTSVSEAILDRDADLSGEIAVAGWYQEPPILFCPYMPPSAVPFLERDCSISFRGFMEAPESIIQVTTTGGSKSTSGTGPIGPAFNAVFPTVAPPAAHPLPTSGGSTPTKAILIGHFNDPRASLCSWATPQQCRDRFVVDAVPWVEGVDRGLPERMDSRDASTTAPPVVDPIEIISRVTSIRSVLSVAAVGPDELVRLWPAFDLTSGSQAKGDSFWIVTLLSDDRGDGAISTFVMDSAGSLFQVTGNTFEVLDPGSPRPS